MATTVDTRYFRVVGVKVEDDGTFTHSLKAVADFEGNPFFPEPAPRAEENRQQEVPRGTIIKLVVTTTVTRQVTLNPTS